MDAVIAAAITATFSIVFIGAFLRSYEQDLNRMYELGKRHGREEADIEQRAETARAAIRKLSETEKK